MLFSLSALFALCALLFFVIGILTRDNVQSWCYFACALCMILATYFLIYPIVFHFP